MAIIKKNALKIRQEFGAILDEIEGGGDPVLIERRSKPIAVLVPYDVFKERFVEFQSNAERSAIIDRFKAALKASDQDTLGAIRELRYGK